MNQRRFNPTTIGVYLVAALLLLNLVAILAQRGGLGFDSAAYAQRQAPIAGGGGLFVMPAQLSRDTWGAYLMDIDRGTICVYQFYPGNRQLHFVAARKFTNDIKLENFNTLPPPQEIGDLVNKQGKGAEAPVVPPPNELAPNKDLK